MVASHLDSRRNFLITSELFCQVKVIKVRRVRKVKNNRFLHAVLLYLLIRWMYWGYSLDLHMVWTFVMFCGMDLHHHRKFLPSKLPGKEHYFSYQSDLWVLGKWLVTPYFSNGKENKFPLHLLLLLEMDLHRILQPLQRCPVLGPAGFVLLGKTRKFWVFFKVRAVRSNLDQKTE